MQGTQLVHHLQLDLVPEGCQFSHHVSHSGEDVPSVAPDGDEQGRSQTMAAERGDAHPHGGPPFDNHKGQLGFGQSFGKVWSRCKRRCEPPSEPSELVLGVENSSIQMDR